LCRKTSYFLHPERSRLLWAAESKDLLFLTLNEPAYFAKPSPFEPNRRRDRTISRTDDHASSTTASNRFIAAIASTVN